MLIIASGLVALAAVVHLCYADCVCSDEERERQGSWLQQNIVRCGHSAAPAGRAPRTGDNGLPPNTNEAAGTSQAARAPSVSRVHGRSGARQQLTGIQETPEMEQTSSSGRVAITSHAEAPPRASVHIVHYIIVPPAMVVPIVTVDMS